MRPATDYRNLGICIHLLFVCTLLILNSLEVVLLLSTILYYGRYLHFTSLLLSITKRIHGSLPIMLLYLFCLTSCIAKGDGTMGSVVHTGRWTVVWDSTIEMTHLNRVPDNSHASPNWA